MPHFDYHRRALKIGDYARNIESGWLGRIEGFEGRGADAAAVMLGVDSYYRDLLGGTLEEAIDQSDRQWHAPGDLRRVQIVG